MSQIKKPIIESKILKAAKAEFVKHGYLNASLRDITKRAGVTLSNLYNYYPNKNALLLAVLKPELDDLVQLRDYVRREPDGEQPYESLEQKKEKLRGVISYIQSHKVELNLLFNQSTTSTLESFADQLAKDYEEVWKIRYQQLKIKFPTDKLILPSSFFLRSMAHFHLTNLKKLLVSDYSNKEMMGIADEIATFLWHGGMGLSK